MEDKYQERVYDLTKPKEAFECAMDEEDGTHNVGVIAETEGHFGPTVTLEFGKINVILPSHAARKLAEVIVKAADHADGKE